MASKEKAHARYLVNPDSGRVELIHADSLDGKKAAGYTEPTGMKANGEAWNLEADEGAQDIAAEFAVKQSEIDEKRNVKESAEREAALKAQEDAADASAAAPDMKVQIVEAPKPDKRR
ncbi:MAG: hypothetical protein H0V66_00255 [Bdellovibrionales bacterium]|nr:hypothetical protein [Bdellovibrionales bacterium]